MSKKDKKNDVKNGKKESSNSKKKTSGVSKNVAVIEKPKTAKSTKAGRIDVLRPSEKQDCSREYIEISQQRIEERARAIWEQRGRPQGDDLSNWYEAENQLRRELVLQD